MTSTKRRSGRHTAPTPSGSTRDPSPVRKTTPINDKYKPGHLVWVKLDRQPWWPAKVVESKCIQESVERHPHESVAVQRFGEDERIEIASPKSLCHYKSPMREKYKEEGLKWKMSKERRDLFQEAVRLSEIEMMGPSDLSSSNKSMTGDGEELTDIKNTFSPTINAEENLNAQDSVPKNCQTTSNDSLPVTQQSVDPQKNSPVCQQPGNTLNASQDHQQSADPQNNPPVTCQQPGDPQDNSPEHQQLGAPQGCPGVPQGSVDVVVNESLSEFTDGTVVWIKMNKLPWWPAQVDEVKHAEGNKPVITVEFFNEDAITYIKDPTKIKPFLCPEREKFATKGMQLAFKERADLFSEAYKLALNKLNMVDRTDSKQTLNNEKDLDPPHDDVLDPVIGERNSEKVCSASSGDGQKSTEAPLTSLKRKGKHSSDGALVSKKRKIQNASDTKSLSKKHRGRVKQLACIGENNGSKLKNLSSMMDQMRKRKIKPVSKEQQSSKLTEDSGGSQIGRSGSKNTGKGQGKTDNSKLRAKRKRKEKLEIEEAVGEELYREGDPGYTESSSPVPYQDSFLWDPPTSDHSESVKEKLESPNSSRKINSLPNSTHKELNPQCSVSSHSDLNSCKTPISRKSKKRKKVNNSEGDDQDIEEGLPALYNRTAVKNGKKSSKKMKSTKKKQCKKDNGQEKQKANIDKPLHDGIDPVYTEASSPIPYDKTLDSEGLVDPEHNEENIGGVSEALLYPSTPTCAPSDAETKQSSCYPEPKDVVLSTQDTNVGEGFDPNLDADDCCVSDSDDEDLPDGLTPSRQAALQENDIVWVKWKGCPVWPAIVKRLHKKKKRIVKVSLLVVEPHHYIPKRFCMNYNPKSVLPYNSKDSDLFMERGSNLEGEGGIRFNRAVELIHNYLTKKILGTLRREDKEFMHCPGEIQEMCEKSPPPSPITEMEALPASPLSIVGEKEDSVVCMGEEDGPATDPEINKRYEKIKEKNESLVEFLKTNEVKQYLLDILREKRKSEKHTTYKCGRSKARDALKNPGFGPIADEEQQEDVLFTMVGWYKQECKLPDKEIPDVNYVLDVWVPEGIVYALIKLRKYSRKKAWEQFEKGVYMTKREKAEIHQSILDSAKRISAEDIQRYEENLQHRMNLICQQSGIQNITFD